MPHLYLFYQGGILFMTLITLAALAALALTIKVLVDSLNGKRSTRFSPNSILIAGSLAFMLGILAQTIDIYHALIAIQRAGHISTILIFGGLKVSMIAPTYGLIIFVISLIIRLVLPFFLSTSNITEG